MTMRSRHLVIAALALVGFASAAAGCGGGGGATPGVANIGTSSSSTTSSDGSSSGGSDGGGRRADGAKFSACMRAHGVRNFPDPSSGGGLTIGPGTGINPESPTFQAAEKACRKLLDIKPPSAAEQAKMQEQALAFSACMRAHGVPNFPDPQFSGGGARLKLDSRSGIDPNSPQFKAAQKACQSKLPGLKTAGGGSGPTTQSGGGKAAP
jgi:hypothetical protein